MRAAAVEAHHDIRERERRLWRRAVCVAVVVSGVNLEIDAAGIVLPRRLKALLFQNEIPDAANAELVGRLAEGALLVFNAAPAGRVDPRILARTDVLVANRVEAAAMTGVSAASLDSERAAREL